MTDDELIQLYVTARNRMNVILQAFEDGVYSEKEFRFRIAEEAANLVDKLLPNM